MARARREMAQLACSYDCSGVETSLLPALAAAGCSDLASSLAASRTSTHLRHYHQAAAMAAVFNWSAALQPLLDLHRRSSSYPKYALQPFKSPSSPPSSDMPSAMLAKNDLQAACRPSVKVTSHQAIRAFIHGSCFIASECSRNVLMLWALQLDHDEGMGLVMVDMLAAVGVSICPEAGVLPISCAICRLQ